MSKKDKKCPKLCCNCKHWDIMYKEEDWEKEGELACGTCHRYPAHIPAAFADDMHVTHLEEPFMGIVSVDHPVVFAFDWCGEFKKMKKPRYTIEEYKKDEEYIKNIEKRRC